MKPTDIKQIMNLARAARARGLNFNPLFSGAPGLGKSEILQQWCNENKLPFIDLRLAYLESPDLIGYPSISTKNGKQVTVHNTPEFWPDAELQPAGVLFLDELNRGTTAVMNTVMQLLTDRRIHGYDLPKDWIVAAAINPENSANDVNTMDTALRDRFEIYEITYDKPSYVSFMKKAKYHEDVISFVETGVYKYNKPEDIGDIVGAKYTSPRTLSKLSNALLSGVEALGDDIEMATYEAALGRNLAMTFYSFRKNETPVTYSDVLTDWRGAKSRLTKFSNPKNYRMAQISITIRDITERFDEKEMKLKDLAKVCLVIPADQAVALLTGLDFRLKKEGKLIDEIIAAEPELKEHFKGLKAV